MLGTSRQALALLAQVREEAIMPGWRGAPLSVFLAACNACNTIGSKTEHYFETQESCDTCLFFAKPVRMHCIDGQIFRAKLPGWLSE